MDTRRGVWLGRETELGTRGDGNGGRSRTARSRPREDDQAGSWARVDPNPWRGSELTSLLPLPGHGVGGNHLMLELSLSSEGLMEE